jgi:proteasome lid subunit RPN8/RPN11
MTSQLKPRLQIPARHAAAIRDAAVAAYPLECCGLLVGEGDDPVLVTEVVPTANIAEDPRRAFAIDPQAQFDLLRATRGARRRVIGHYHSHPDGGAAPSAHDLAMAHDPEAVWVVVAASPHKVEVRAFHRPEGADAFVEIAVSALS